MHVPEEPQPSPNLSRRTLAAGAAWSIPVIAMTATAPMASASCASAGDQVYAPGNHTLTLPDCASQVTFEVIGGGAFQGRGAAITGTFTLPARGVTLRLIVGAGGTTSDAGGVGGAGFGNGGSSPASARRGAGGGGGSAILIGSTPYVVAGGAGAGGTSNSTRPTGSLPGWLTDSLTIATAPQNGVRYGTGDAGPAPSNGNGRVANFGGANLTTFVNVAGGQPGVRGQSRLFGNGGVGIGYNSFPASFTASGEVRGGNGGDFGTGANGGGDGGRGVKIGPISSLEGITGGGGGGYAGGGGGGGGYVSYNPNPALGHVFSAGGGSGSSFTGGAGVSVSSMTVGPVSSATTSQPSAQGRIRISWI